MRDRNSKLHVFLAATRLALAVSLLCVAANLGCAELNKIAVVEKAGGFVYHPPKDWEVIKVPVSDFKAAVEPVNQNRKFRAGLFFARVNSKGGFDKNVNRAVELAERKLGARTIGRSRFKTNSGLLGYRVSTEATPDNVDELYTFYFLRAKRDQQIIVTAMSLKGDGYEDTFDECVKSLKLR